MVETSEIPKEKWGPPLMVENSVPNEMHKRVKEISKNIGVKKAGREVVDLGKLTRRKSLQKKFSSAKEKQIQACYSRSTL